MSIELFLITLPIAYLIRKLISVLLNYVPGYYGHYTQRNFNARWFVFNSDNARFASEGLGELAFNDIFTASLIDDNDLWLEENTNATDYYSGTSIIAAPYVGGFIPLKDKVNIATGVRVEYFKQDLSTYVSASDFTTHTPASISKLSVLPSLNLTYKIFDKDFDLVKDSNTYRENSLLQARLVYASSVNRPVFREIAPFSFYDFNRGINIAGNPDLTTAQINNVGARLEFYPRKGQVISFGGFYKSFINPIETVIRTSGDQDFFSYVNAKSAQSYGIEMEVKTVLAGKYDKARKSFYELSLSTNGSLLKSNVLLNDADIAAGLISNRPLQGQSPWILNTRLSYSSDKKGYDFNLLYNIFGPRIAVVGLSDIFEGSPSLYEQPRHLFDFTASKTVFDDKGKVTFAINDILSYKTVWYVDNDQSRSISNEDNIFMNLQNGRGAYYSIAFNYNLQGKKKESKPAK